jgi:hypothetical protein
VQNSVFRNNLLYDNHATGIALFRIDGGGPSSGDTVVNNTVINASNARYDLLINGGSVNNTVFNNVFYNLNTSTTRGSISITNDSTAGFKSDYNFLDPRFEIENVSNKTFAQWKPATGGDAHSQTLTLTQMQALFANYASNDFTLAGTSAARDAGIGSLLNGVLKPAPAEDLRGVGRPMGNGFDVGAYESRVLPGDANYDGTVNRDDFLILYANFGQQADFKHGDFDHDGRATFTDFLILEANFGRTLGESGVALSVPEPAGPLGAGTIISLIALLRRRTKRHGDFYRSH